MLSTKNIFSSLNIDSGDKSIQQEIIGIIRLRPTKTLSNRHISAKKIVCLPQLHKFYGFLATATAAIGSGVETVTSCLHIIYFKELLAWAGG